MRMRGCTATGKQRLTWILLQATLPPGLAEDEVDSYEAFVLVGRVSKLSNAATPAQDPMVPFIATTLNATNLSDAGNPEEDDTAIVVAPARMATRRTPVDETPPVDQGD